MVTMYCDIITVEEDDLDCLSIEALFVELLCEEELGMASIPDLSEA